MRLARCRRPRHRHLVPRAIDHIAATGDDGAVVAIAVHGDADAPVVSRRDPPIAVNSLIEHIAVDDPIAGDPVEKPQTEVEMRNSSAKYLVEDEIAFILLISRHVGKNPTIFQETLRFARFHR